jgi:hypothetical protein
MLLGHEGILLHEEAELPPSEECGRKEQLQGVKCMTDCRRSFRDRQE